MKNIDSISSAALLPANMNFNLGIVSKGPSFKAVLNKIKNGTEANNFRTSQGSDARGFKYAILRNNENGQLYFHITKMGSRPMPTIHADLQGTPDQGFVIPIRVNKNGTYNFTDDKWRECKNEDFAIVAGDI